MEEQLEINEQEYASYKDIRKELLHDKERKLTENENQIKDCEAILANTADHLTEEEFTSAMERIHLFRNPVAARKASNLEPLVPKPIPSEANKTSIEFEKRPLAPVATQPMPISLLPNPSTALDILAHEASKLSPAASHDMSRPQPSMLDLYLVTGLSRMPLTDPYEELSSPHTGSSTAGPEYAMGLPRVQP